MKHETTESIQVLIEAIELQGRKSDDYQNSSSHIRQADYYPHGCATIADIIHSKSLRIQSVLEAMANDPNYEPNFESLQDSCIDIANYASFFVSYARGKMDGQDPNRDFLNRAKAPVKKETLS